MEPSKSLKFARHINVRRKTRPAALAEAWKVLLAEIVRISKEVRAIDYYHDLALTVNREETQVELASLRGVMMNISPKPDDGSVWFTIGSSKGTGDRREKHYYIYFKEWRDREGGERPGATSSELADSLIFEFLQEDERAAQAATEDNTRGPHFVVP